MRTTVGWYGLACCCGFRPDPIARRFHRASSSGHGPPISLLAGQDPSKTFLEAHIL